MWLENDAIFFSKEVTSGKKKIFMLEVKSATLHSKNERVGRTFMLVVISRTRTSIRKSNGYKCSIL